MGSRQLSAVLVGAGHRGVLYSGYAHIAPDDLRLVAVVDPDPIRRARVAEEFALPAGRLFDSLDDLPRGGEFAEIAIDATMDADHVPTAITLLELGYHVLLEKPIAPSAAELNRLSGAAEASDRALMICHVLRYAPFYVEVKSRILAGEIGEIISIEMAEHVSYDHAAMGFVRGRWANSEQSGSGILLAKCCHDLDLMSWLNNTTSPLRVASTGSRQLFTADRAPVGAGTRCLSDCPIEPECAYSAKRNYIDLNKWQQYAWESIEDLGSEPTLDQKLHSLATDNPYGVCVWGADNDVMDRQSVAIEFADGSLGNFMMACNSATPGRTITIVGTKGDLTGSLEDGTIRIRQIAATGDRPYTAEHFTVDVTGDMHGGGDLRLVADFVATVRGETQSVSSTTIADSLNGHLMVYAAELARTERRWVDLQELMAQ